MIGRASIEEGTREQALRRLWLPIAAIALAALTLALRPDATVFLMPLSEDGYYALSIARNIAAGNGVTIDGVLPTNGFQPLFTFIQAGLFRLAGGDDFVAIRLLLLVHWILFLATAWIVALVAGDALPGGPAERRARQMLAGFLYLAGSYLFLHHFNGLETGLLLFLYAICWRFVQRSRAENWAGCAILGVLLGLTVLTRIDAAILVVVLALRELWVRRGSGWAVALGRAALLGGVAFLVSLPWWAFNLIEFGSPMPISGAAQQDWGPDGLRLRWILWALGVATYPWLFLGQFESHAADWLRLPLWAAGAWLAWRLLRPDPAKDDATAARGRGFARALAAAMLALAALYCLSSFAFWFYSRYLAPLALVGIVALAAPGGSWIARWPRLPIAGAAVLAAPVLVLAALAWRGQGLYGTIMFWDQLLLVREHVPHGERAAAGQSGSLGFFRPGTVNVDGKVNPEVHAYAGRIPAYLRERGIRWFVDWPWYVEKALGPDPEALGWRPVARRANFILYRHEGR